MTSEHLEVRPAPRTSLVSRFVGHLAKAFTWTTMLAVTGLGTAAGTTACGEEVFEACECKFTNCMAPDPVAGMVPAPQTVCTMGEYTYEECGVYCYETVPKDLLAKEAAGLLSSCGGPNVDGVYTITPAQNSVLAKNSCSPGAPVGP